MSSRSVTTTFYWILALALAFSLLLMLPPQAVYAATIIVNTDVDESDGSCSDGDCSLRDAIAVAVDGDTITFAGATGIYLNSELVIGRPLTIDGGNYEIVVSGDTGNDGSPDVRVFNINAGSVVTLSHLSVISGTIFDYPGGGGILNYGALTVIHSTLSGNSTNTNGGGIASYYALTVTHSTFTDNVSSNTGGGIYNESGPLVVSNSTFSGNSTGFGGGIYNSYGMLTVVNSTLSNNSANSQGGGIFNYYGILKMTNSTLSGNSATDSGGGIFNNGTLTMLNNTLSGSSATYGGGIFNNNGTMDYQNTLIANSDSYEDCYNSRGTIGANLNNLVEDGSCSASLFGDPLLAPLADNGGDTLTHALLSGSPAIDAVPLVSCTLTTDQRGFPRPYPVGGACDIGAYEDDVWPLRLQKSVVPAHDVPYHGLVTYTLSLNNAGGSADSGARLTDTLPAEVDFAGWIVSPTNTTLSGGEIRWQGTLNAGQTLTWSFQARHNGIYRQRVINDAAFSGDTGGGNRRAIFDVACGSRITVQNANDSGAGSLRQAIDDACSGGVIDFDQDYAIYLDSELFLNKSLMIDGSGHTLILSGDSGNDGSPNVRVFNIDFSAVVTLSHISIINATSSDGGGIVNFGALTIMNSTLSDNSTDFFGGGVSNYGELAVINSTLSSNTAWENGGGIYNHYGTLTITNSTFSGNSASYSGGGIYNGGGTLNYQNTLMADNPGGDCTFGWGAIGTNRNNLVEDGSCDAALSGDPLLGPLADNGGGTLTHALLPGSPAIDVVPVSDCPLTTDQRDFPRPYPAGGACDIGAYEDDAWALRLHKSVTPTNAVPYHGLVTYTLSLSNLGAGADHSARLTDTLPVEVDFAAWVISPTGTTLNNDEIRWQGTLDAGQTLTWSFQARHIGDYEDHVSNTVSFSGDIGQVSRQTTFGVVCGSHIIVQTANDDGVGSLRRAVDGVCPGGVIEFDNDYTIYLNSELALNKRVTIDGSDHTITVSGDSGNNGSPNVRVFSINPGNVVTLSHLSIISGTASEGGGVANYGGLTVIHSVLSGNMADSGGGISNNGGDMTVISSTLSGNVATYYGGGIYNTGTLIVMNSTLFDNSANDSGGGIQNAFGMLTIMNSTLSGNSAAYYGGGINNNFGTLTMLNDTLSDNAATYSGGVENDMGALYYQNTLIANSSSGIDCHSVDGGIIGASNNNLVEDGSCNAELSGDPLIGPLADNGGDTWTHALLSGSPAIDAVPLLNCSLTSDQRGFPRPYPSGGMCDIGAYEDDVWPLRLQKSVNPTTDAPYHGLVTYTLSLRNVGAVADPNVRLTDTLPGEVDFAGWIISPTNTTLSGDEIRWQGALDAGQVLTWSFQARHVGDYKDHVTNEAIISGDTSWDSGGVAFDVICGPYVVVRNANDSGAGSLRRAISDVCSGGVIDFDSDYTFYLDSELTINKPVTINESGRAITVSGDSSNDGSPNVRVFNVGEEGVVILNHFNIISGTADEGGGILSHGVLTVNDSSLSGNSANYSGGGIFNHYRMLTINNSTISNNSVDQNGGGVSNSGTLNIIRSTLFGNAAGNGGGIYNHVEMTINSSTLSGNSANEIGGGIYSDGAMAVNNSTLSDNSAVYSGGGIYNGGMLGMTNNTLSGNSGLNGGGIFNDNILTMINNTLSGNSAVGSGGIYNNGTLNYQNTIIANSVPDEDCFSWGSIGTNLNNLVEDGSCNAALYGDPLLGPLADNGGDTWTHALLLGSPAIDVVPVSECPLTTDQRGFPRPYPAGDACDIGAYEDETVPLRFQKSVTPTSDVLYHGLVTYTLSLRNVGASIETNVRLTDTLPVEVDFAGWIISPTNTTLNGDEILWQGSVDAGQALIWSFRARHTGDYMDHVINEATFSSNTVGGHRSATFSVVCGPLAVVHNANDSGIGSLRQAIDDVCPGGVIDFDNDYAIYLNNELVIDKPLTIDGIEHAITVSGDTGNDGSNNVRVFNVGASGIVTLSHLNIVSGTAYEGGGISNYGVLTVTDSTLSDNWANESYGGAIFNSGVLAVNNSTFSDNTASFGGGIYNNNYGVLTMTNDTLSGNLARSGGGIYNSYNTLTLSNSTLSGNRAVLEDGGGIFNEGTLTANNNMLFNNQANGSGGGIYNSYGTLMVNNSTFSGNQSNGSGGGIYNGGTLVLIHGTFSDNLANYYGGGIYNFGSLSYQNTLIANSVSNGDCANYSGIIDVNLNNLVEDGSCNAALSGDPLLGPLADNGGDTQTHALLSGSPAIDAVPLSDCPLTTDQRGFSRPDPASGACDIGAYEEQSAIRIQKSVTPTTEVPYHGLVTYTLSLYNAGTIASSGVRLTDTLPVKVDFAGWIVSPTNTTLNDDEIHWQGTMAAGQVLTWSFQARHTGDYGDYVVNEAAFSDEAGKGSRSIAFRVVCGSYAVVRNANDDGTDSLRQAVEGVCPGGVVTFDNDYAIYLDSTLTINKPVTIDGSGHAITISGDSGNDGSHDVRVFDISASSIVTLNRLNIVNGYAIDGGAIYNSGTLALTNSSLSGNLVSNYGGGIYNTAILTMTHSTLSGNSAGYGGGIYEAYGSLTTIANSTFSDNQASGSGGGIVNNYGILVVMNNTFVGNTAYEDGGGIYNAGDLTMDNSTFSDNSANYLGGGISNYSGILRLTNDTFSGNSAGNTGGGIYNGSTLHYQNTVIANSVSGGDCDNSWSTIGTNLNNLVEDGSCNAALFGDPLLGPLVDNGGDTQTHALLSGSPAIDAVPLVSCTLTTDQRGYLRPYPTGGACDIGSYEFGSALPTYTLTVETAGNGAVTLNPPGGVYTAGTQVTLTATPDSDWTFAGWSGALTTDDAVEHLTMDADKVVTATFTQEPVITHTLAVNVIGQGTVNPMGGVYVAGVTVTLTAAPDAGWSFDGWSGAATGTITQTQVVMDADKWVTATFSLIPVTPTYTLTTHVAGNGVVALDPPGGVYTAGTQVTLTATPDSGWYFAGWTGDLNTANAVEHLTLDANKVVTATFTQEPVITYTLTTHVAGNGAVTLDPPGGVYTAGTQVTLTATPDSGWYFAGWTGDLNTANAVEHLTLDANKAVTATFTQEPVVTYTLTITVTGSGSGVVTPTVGAHSYISGTLVILGATPADGSRFDGWSGDADCADGQVVLNAARLCAATFTLEERRIYLPLVTRSMP